MLDRIIDFLISIVKIFQFWVLVYAYERGVVLRLGKFHRVIGPDNGVRGTGFHWCIPFHVDHVLVDNVVLRTIRLGAQSLTTKDGQTIVVSAVISLSIDDIKKALLEVESVEHAMIDSCCGAIADHVDESNWDQLIGEASFQKLTRVCKREAKRYGIDVQRVKLADRAISRTYRLLNSDHATMYEDSKVKVRL